MSEASAEEDIRVTESLLGALRASEDQVVDGDGQQVKLRQAPASNDIAKELGRTDGRNPGRDPDSADLELPHQRVVQEIAQGPRAALGVAAKDISTTYYSGKLGVVEPTWIVRTTSKFYLVMIGIVVALVTVFETLVGQRVWQRLVAGITEDKAIAASLVLTAILAIGAVGAARYLHSRYPGFISAYAGRVVLGWLVLVTLTAALLAYVLGGGVQAEPTTGGISGGGRSTSPTFIAQHFHVILALAYFALLVVANVAILGLHLYERHHDDVRHVDANVAERHRARNASVDPSRVQLLYVYRLKECLEALDFLNHHGREVVGAYNSGVRSTVGAELNGIWPALVFDDDEPLWVAEVDEQIRLAEKGVRISVVR